MEKKLIESIISLIASGIYPNTTWSSVNTILIELNKLKEPENNKK